MWVRVREMHRLAMGWGIAPGSAFHGAGAWAPIQEVNFTGLVLLFRGASLSLCGLGLGLLGPDPSFS